MCNYLSRLNVNCKLPLGKAGLWKVRFWASTVWQYEVHTCQNYFHFPHQLLNIELIPKQNNTNHNLQHCPKPNRSIRIHTREFTSPGALASQIIYLLCFHPFQFQSRAVCSSPPPPPPPPPPSPPKASRNDRRLRQLSTSYKHSIRFPIILFSPLLSLPSTV
jgi:hypothetical protein